MKKNTYAVVTGASQGIGKAIAKELAKRGYNLVMVALHGSLLKEAAQSIKSEYHSDVIYFEADLTKPGEIKKFEQWLKNQQIDVEVWINNAGMGYEGGIGKFNQKFFKQLLDLNIRALVMLSLLFIREIKSKGREGYLLNVGSVASFFSLPNKTVYAASKTFVLNFSRSLKEEVLQHRIYVSCLCPGPVSTNSEVTARIKKAGFRARYFTTGPEKLAEIAITGLLRKKTVIVPTFGNKILRLISVIVPHSVILLVTRTLFSKGEKSSKKDVLLKPDQ